jgi:hypothetical protein
LNELVIKAKDLKTSLYEECLSKELAKTFVDKIDQMIVSLMINRDIEEKWFSLDRMMLNDLQQI